MKPGEIAHNVSRGAFYLAVEKGAALVSGIAYFALLLRWLGPTKYGIMTLALSFAGLATTATGNFEMFLERYAAEYQARGTLHVLRRAQWMALWIKTGLGVLASVILVILAPTLAHQFDTPELAWLLPPLTGIVMFDGFSTTGRATLFGLQRFRPLSLVSVAFHVVKTVMVGLMWWAGQGLLALAIGFALLTALQGLIVSGLAFWMLRDAREPAPEATAPDPRPTLLRPMFAYCMPLLGARAAFLSGQNLGKIVLGKLFDATHLGYFSFAFQTVERFIELFYTVPYSLLPSLTYLVAREERARLRDIFDQAFRLIQVAACALSFVLFVFAHEITLLVGGPSFEPAIPVVRIMALVPIARTAQQPLTMLFQAMRRPGTVLSLAILKFGTELSCYFLLVPSLTLIGAGIANLAGAALSFVAALALLGVMMPEGAGERARTVFTSVALLVPMLALALTIDRHVAVPVAIALRLLLAPVALLGVFALGLVNRYDLVKLSSVSLSLRVLRVSRDWVVSGADRVARAFEPRSVP
ncbi:MAG: hypothetical protein A2W00_11085 [Candidatus Eisenbacteria bacterium RBG_16_71_46]|nr:MAG: hypothetical protein A2W00_11085 [Candidatus Eisenbacteria bacterium RBG_16_71_46]